MKHIFEMKAATEILLYHEIKTATETTREADDRLKSVSRSATESSPFSNFLKQHFQKIREICPNMFFCPSG